MEVPGHVRVASPVGQAGQDGPEGPASPARQEHNDGDDGPGPFAQGGDEAHPAMAPAGEEEHPLPEGLPIVLVIEDDPDIASAIRQCLLRHGYGTRRAHNGPSALTLAPLHTYAMVLLDWRLPGHPRGAELVRRLRTLCHYRLPVVVISADPEALTEARDAGVEDYLPKPFRLEDLVHVVDEHSR